MLALPPISCSLTVEFGMLFARLEMFLLFVTATFRPQETATFQPHSSFVAQADGVVLRRVCVHGRHLRAAPRRAALSTATFRPYFT
eukprot:COSAG02_NODE_27660_length_605_cov_0.703557_2_plen_85_part_01